MALFWLAMEDIAMSLPGFRGFAIEKARWRSGFNK
jgi:hypothetical protein